MATRKLNSIKFPDIADTYILDADKVNYSDSETYANGSVGKALQNKAEVDGSYESMTVGNAEQLVSNVRVNDKTPYLFRTSGGSVDIGDREYVNGIVGGTVTWNQLAPNNYSKATSGSVAFNSGTSIVAGHKYLITRKLSANVSIGNSVYFYTNGSTAQDIRIQGTDTAVIQQASHSGTSDGTTQWNADNTWIYQSATTDPVTVSDLQIFDLTQMFGSTIADYIYSLETATAGAGVAWFKKLFNKPYYAYNAGELMSVSGLVSHDMSGFNQASSVYVNETDDVWTATLYTEADLLPNTTYCISFVGASGNKLYTNENLFKQPVIRRTLTGSREYIVATTVDYLDRTATTQYINGKGWVIFKNDGAPSSTNTVVAEFSDVCLNIAWDGSRNGEYEPYELHSYPLDDSLTLRGIPKLDANNNLYYDGDIYEPDGTVTRKYGIVDLGTLTWTRTTTASNHYRFYSGDIQSTVKKPSSLTDVANIICQKYISIGGGLPNDEVTGVGIHTNGNVIIYDANYNDATASDFKTAMSGVYLVYELATPTTETADPYQQTEIVNDFGTEEYVISDGTFAVPVGSDTDYPVNLVAKLEMAPNSPDGSGDFIVRQTNGVNEYVPLVIEDALPTIPSTAGTYTLTVTVADGADPVLSWEAE